ncbi:hypothetical protein BU14_2410s0001 [Porphyra umbilicalis]|uniref:Uncharacterized protein n=1 Tax=Porphyra umbilicalis TaxID=2786 RepID=A0A1X6NJ77_PORUM|nr:hypothetical protein BU14_2410s0001 [Porphyra umbilicalis]|eukprot:OSX68668.1 hypothetical protein BU14_2410s0001 [Porphyra umbilicalis]
MTDTPGSSETAKVARKPRQPHEPCAVQCSRRLTGNRPRPAGPLGGAVRSSCGRHPPLRGGAPVARKSRHNRFGGASRGPDPPLWAAASDARVAGACRQPRDPGRHSLSSPCDCQIKGQTPPSVPVLPSPLSVVFEAPRRPCAPLQSTWKCPQLSRPGSHLPRPCRRPTRPFERSMTTPLRAVRARTVCRGACSAGPSLGGRQAAWPSRGDVQTGAPDGAAPRALRATARDGSTHHPPSLPLPSKPPSGRQPPRRSMSVQPPTGDCNRRGGARQLPAGMGRATGGGGVPAARPVPHAGDRFERELVSAIAAAALWRHHRPRGHAAAGRPAERGGPYTKRPARQTPHTRPAPRRHARARVGAHRLHGLP